MKTKTLIVLVLAINFLKGQRRLDPAITIEPVLIDFRICSGDADVAFLRSHIRLKITNASSISTVAIAKSDLHVDGIFVAKTVRNIFEEEFENKIYPSFVNGGISNLSRLDEKLFLSLRPKEEGILTTSFDLPIAVHPGVIPRGVVARGEHLVTLSVSAWFDSADVATRIESLFPGIGTLWIRSTRTKPVRVIVTTPAPVQVHYCA